jgi:hypothetical protein
MRAQERGRRPIKAQLIVPSGKISAASERTTVMCFRSTLAAHPPRRPAESLRGVAVDVSAHRTRAVEGVR